MAAATMLREIANVAQEPGSARRRWFRCDDMDLFTWQEANGTMLRFQLTARSRAREVACTWAVDDGLVTGEVDDGSGGMMKHPGAPLIVRGEGVDTADLAARFAAHAGALDEEIRTHVIACLRQTAPSAPAAVAAMQAAGAPGIGSALLVLLFALLALLLGLLQRGAH